MKYNEMTPRYQALLRRVTHLPQQILSLHGIENMTEYVLHSLCDESCLNLSKAAYFVDNPDFDCLKGVAGFSKDDEIYTCDTVLDDREHFKEHINGCAFNKRVRSLILPSPRRSMEAHDKHAHHLGGLLGMENPQFHSWTTKHDNYGLLIFEREDIQDLQGHDELLEALSILGFCPVH